MGRAPREPLPLCAFVGDSGVGKTTLIAGVIRNLVRRGLRVGAIKHSGGFADPDRPGKDSHTLRQAGAAALVLASREATVSFHAHPGAEPSFEQRLGLLGGDLDLVLVESYRSQELPTIEVLRRGVQEEARFLGQPRLLAVAADFQPAGLALPLLDLDDPPGAASFLLRAFSLG